MAKVEVGDKWGSLEVTDIRIEPITRIDGAVKETRNECSIYMRCKCGNEFSRAEREMPGRRELRDCGCGLSSNNSRPELFTVSLDRSTAARLMDYCRDNRVNTSSAIRFLLRAGLDTGIEVPEDRLSGRGVVKRVI